MRITEVAKDVEVCCSALYFVSNDTFIADTSSVLSPLSVLVADSSARYLHEFGQNSVQKIKLNKKLTRIFIGRSGRRNLINYKECLDFFNKLGFVEVFPHRLSYREKLELFANAEYIVGPGSSGFSNVIYCRKLKGLIKFYNVSRHTDMYLTKLANSMSVPLYLVLGKEVISWLILTILSILVILSPA